MLAFLMVETTTRAMVKNIKVGARGITFSPDGK
jgi:hypothetical protein